jgi:hypothetical protein
MTRPHNIQDLAPDIREYIERIEQKLKDTETDGIGFLLTVSNRKLHEIGRYIDDFEFKIDSSDDKSFERFWNIMKDIKKIAEDHRSLMISLGIKEEDNNGKRLSPQERLVMRRKEEKDVKS